MDVICRDRSGFDGGRVGASLHLDIEYDRHHRANLSFGVLFTKMNVTSGLQGALTAFLITFCIYHLPLMNAYMFAGEPYGLAWITGGYSMTWLTITGFVLGSWTKETT